MSIKEPLRDLDQKFTQL